METSHPQFLYWSKILFLQFMRAQDAATVTTFQDYGDIYAISAQATSSRQASGCRMGLLHSKQLEGTHQAVEIFFWREHVFLKTGGVFCGVDSNKAELASAIESTVTPKGKVLVMTRLWLPQRYRHFNREPAKFLRKKGKLKQD